jgi:hypothetical protein
MLFFTAEFSPDYEFGNLKPVELKSFTPVSED